MPLPPLSVVVETRVPIPTASSQSPTLSPTPKQPRPQRKKSPSSARPTSPKSSAASPSPLAPNNSSTTNNNDGPAKLRRAIVFRSANTSATPARPAIQLMQHLNLSSY